MKITVKSIRLELLLTWCPTFCECTNSGNSGDNLLIGNPYGMNQDIQEDISDDCIQGQTISTYLTTGMGITDTFVAMVAKEDVNCSLKFLVNNENYIIVVIEFLDWVIGKPQCGDIKNEVNVMVRESSVLNICYEIEDNIIRKLGKGELSVSVKARHDMETVKITATSAKVSRYGKCEKFQVKCLFGDKIYCMTEDSKCDGNVNCGVRNKYDEDPSDCEIYDSVSPGMVIVGLVIVFLTFCMMVALLKKLVPNREGTFIVKEDETLSDKDRATGEKDFEVNVRVLSDEMEMGDAEMDAVTGSIQEKAFRRGNAVRKSKLRKMR